METIRKRLMNAWGQFGLLLVTTIFIFPAYDFGFDSFYQDGLVRGLFTPLDIPTKATYLTGYHLYPLIHGLTHWYPTVSWSSVICQFLFLNALALLFLLFKEKRLPLIQFVLCYLLMLVHWAHLQQTQVGFWPAVIGGFAFIHPHALAIRIYGLVLFTLAFISRDVTAILALAILSSYILFHSTVKDIPKFIPNMAILSGIIILFIFMIPIFLNTTNLNVIKSFVLCNDFMLCNHELLNSADLKIYDRVFTNWFAPEGSVAELSKVERVVSKTQPGIHNLFSSFRMRMLFNLAAEQYWISILSIFLFILLLVDSLLSKRNRILKLLAISIPVVIMFIRFSPFWVANLFSGLLIILILQREFQLLHRRFIYYGSTLVVFVCIMYWYYIVYLGSSVYVQAINSLPDPQKPTVVIGSGLHFAALANVTPAGIRPKMFEPCSQTKYYPLVEMGANAEGFHKEVAQQGGFANWLAAMSKKQHVLFAEEEFAEILMEYVREQNPNSSVQLRPVRISFLYGHTPIYEYQIMTSPS